jgi:hypothetical protein
VTGGAECSESPAVYSLVCKTFLSARKKFLNCRVQICDSPGIRCAQPQPPQLMFLLVSHCFKKLELLETLDVGGNRFVYGEYIQRNNATERIGCLAEEIVFGEESWVVRVSVVAQSLDVA